LARGALPGRERPLFTAFMSKKKALTMLRATWPLMILASARLSMRSAVS